MSPCLFLYGFGSHSAASLSHVNEVVAWQNSCPRRQAKIMRHFAQSANRLRFSRFVITGADCRNIFLKLGADQGIASAQYNHGNCLHHGEDVSIDRVSGK
jgi:hypothetical protein